MHDEIRRIVLLCSAGISTNLLVRRMEAEAARLGYPCSISCYPVVEAVKRQLLPTSCFWLRRQRVSSVHSK